MSHFTVTIITETQPDQEKIAEILQPWHEYECTGIEDQYVQNVDITEEVEADFKKYGKDESLEEFAKEWNGSERAEDGRFYNRTNPNARWDWWQIGGRWTGSLHLKNGIEAILGKQAWCAEAPESGMGDIARKDQINWAAMNASEPFATFAVVKDGEWFERGKMGWWAAVADEMDATEWAARYSSLVDELPDTAWLTIVDCHI